MVLRRGRWRAGARMCGRRSRGRCDAARRCHLQSALPVTGPWLDQAAGEIEGAAPAIFLQHRRADAGGAVRDVVEGEAHHRLACRTDACGAAQEMPGEAIGDARLEGSTMAAHLRSLSNRSDAGVRASAPRKPSQLPEDALSPRCRPQCRGAASGRQFGGQLRARVGCAPAARNLRGLFGRRASK